MHRFKFARSGQHRLNETMVWVFAGIFITYVLAIAAFGAITGR